MSGTDPYPRWFESSARKVWDKQAGQRLSSVRSSISGPQEPSAEAARHWLQRQGCQPFLNEVALRSLVFAAPPINRAAEGISKAVDWVAETTRGALFLVEAKSALDSAGIGHCMDGRDKFTATLEALRDLARFGGVQLPDIEGLVITARTVNISPHSSWSVAERGGHLFRSGAAALVGRSEVRVVIVRF